MSTSELHEYPLRTLQALAAWWSEQRCRQRWGHLVRPDGFGRWTEAGRTVEFFFDYDTGSETIARVVRKLNGRRQALSGFRCGPDLAPVAGRLFTVVGHR